MDLAWHLWSTLAESGPVLSFCLFFLFPLNVVSDPFIPLSQLVMVVLIFPGSVCDYAVSFWKHILISCNPIFYLHNNSTVTVFTVCAVIGISVISVLLADLYVVIFSLGSLFRLLAGFLVSCLVMVIYPGISVVLQAWFCLDLYF